MIHEYLDGFFTGLQKGAKGAEAHAQSQWETSTRWVPKLRQLSQAAFMAGEEEVAKDIQSLGTRAGHITTRWFAARGQHDAERYEVLFIEKPLDSQLNKVVRTRGVVDLGTRDRETGRISIWEHKSTGSVPPPSTRLRDMQTLLYAEQLRHFYDVLVDSVIWDYLRTKEPTVPEVLKSSKVPALTKRADLDSTWEVYAEAAKENSVELDSSYDAVRQRLDGREITVFFPRYEQVIVADSRVMLRDYLRTSLEIRRFEERYSEGIVEPIRTLTNSCDWCEFNILCQAAITGGDLEELIRMKYEQKGRD
jgi:hypothetical protein